MLGALPSVALSLVSVRTFLQAGGFVNVFVYEAMPVTGIPTVVRPLVEDAVPARQDTRWPVEIGPNEAVY